MNEKIKQRCYLLSLKGHTYGQIANELNLSKPTVCRAIASITKSHDYQLGINTITEFIDQYNRAEDYFRMQMRELEEMKLLLDGRISDDNDNNNKPSNATATFTTIAKYFELKLKIMDSQTNLMSKVLELASQGKVVMALKTIREERLKPMQQQSTT